MVNRLKIGLLYGGRSGEHEVSLCSAASVLKHLDRQKYEVIPIGIDKQGCFYLNDDEELLHYSDALPVITQQAKPLPSLLMHGRFALDIDVVFPVVHGPLYEDGALQGLLELAGIAYVGCDVLSSALCMNKDIARRIACGDGIASARYRAVPEYASSAEIQTFCDEIAAEFGWPLFVKPCSLGSSVGIHRVENISDLKHAIADARRYDRTVLVESFIEGREIELAVLENPSPNLPSLVSIPGEVQVQHDDGFYSYHAKYLESDKTLLHIPADLSASTIQRLQSMALTIFTRLGCRGMGRVDFFVNDATNAIYFNEINTIPGFTSISMYPKLWEASGIAYPELLDKLIELARRHHDERQQLVTHYQ